LNKVLKYSAFILFGAPGCGKGTQGRALGALPGFFHCSCGDVFRSISPASTLGKLVSEYTGRGELVPDSITVELWKSHIYNRIQHRLFCPDNDKLLLDGIPRNVAQAVLLDDFIQVKALFNLRCPDHFQLTARLRKRAMRENRLDDASQEVIQHRLEVYEITSRPLLEFFGPKLVHHIDSQQCPEAVLYELLEKIRSIT
jgi:adenylate kinase